MTAVPGTTRPAPRTAQPAPDESAVALGRAGRAGIYALVVLRLAEAALWTLVAFAILETAPTLSSIIEDVAWAPVFLAVAALDVVIAVGLLRRYRWAWVLTMLLTGLGLATTIYLVMNGEHDLLRLAILVATALFLNQRPVRLRFGIGT